MPPKQTSGSSTVYLVFIGTGVDSIHASIESANTRSANAKEGGKDNVRVEVQQLVGGSVTADPAPKVKPASKPKSKAVKAEDAEEDNDEDADDAPAPPKANTAAKKTKSPAEQRAANASKPSKPTEGDVADNVKQLLEGNGKQLEGLRIVVTGVPPKMGRKNAEKLVQLYGGSLTKSLSKTTSCAVVGNDAGPTKLDKIAELGIETWNEDELVAKIESGSNGAQASVGGEEDNEEEAEEEEEEEEEEKPKSKKRKTTKA